MATLSSYEADEKGRPRSAVEIVTGADTRIYLLPVETFPGHFNNLYLVDHPDHPTLVDAGTGLPAAQAELGQRFDEIRRRFGVRTSLDDVAEVVVSHAHIDHFGGARELAGRGIPIAVHELDARVLEGFEERLLLATRDLSLYLLQTGLAAAEVEALGSLYRGTKHLFSDLEPDRRLRNRDRIGPGWPVLHVPGHCPGMVCLAVDDVVLTADHLLARVTPVQRPQSITPFMGLENYLSSLEKLLELGSFSVGLGGHEAPMLDVRGRIAETVAHHERRLREVSELCAEEARTVAEISDHLFGRQSGYGVLLALSEAGAHVEFLHELRYLVVENIEDVSVDVRVPPRYRSRDRTPHPILERTRLWPPTESDRA